MGDGGPHQPRASACAGGAGDLALLAGLAIGVGIIALGRLWK